MFIDFNNPRSAYKFNLTGRKWVDGASLEEIATSCTDFVTGIQAAWGDSVRGASRDAMYGFLLIAMLLTPYEIKYLGLDEVIDVDDINVIRVLLTTSRVAIPRSCSPVMAGSLTYSRNSWTALWSFLQMSVVRRRSETYTSHERLVHSLTDCSLPRVSGRTHLSFPQSRTS